MKEALILLGLFFAAVVGSNFMGEAKANAANSKMNTLRVESISYFVKIIFLVSIILPSAISV
jgi:hypothetical protein